LNILRFVEMPQAVAMAAEHGRVEVTGAGAGDWGFVSAVGAALDWEPERVRIEVK
jgi:hypothetical protein